MNKRIRIATDLCFIFMKTLLLVVTYLFFLALINQGQLDYSGIPMIIFIVLGDYLLKLISTDYIFYLIGHVVFIPIILFLNFSNVEEVGLIGVTVLSSIGSIQFWKNEVVTQRQNKLQISLSGIVLFILVELVSGSLGYKSLSRLTFFMGLGFILLYYLRSHYNSMLDFFTTNAGIKNVPFQRIFVLNSGLNLILLLSSLLLLLFTYITNLGRIVGFLGNGLGSVLLYFIKRFQPKIKTPPINTVIPTEPTPPPQLDLDLLGGAQKANPILGFILNLLVKTLFIGLILSSLYILYHYLKLYLRRYRPKTDIMEYTEAITDIKKANRVNKNRFTSLFTSSTNNQKIRRIYYKRIKYYQKSLVEVTSHDTPGEIDQKVENKTSDTIHTLTKIYEQARYGDAELSSEDVAKAKSARD